MKNDCFKIKKLNMKKKILLLLICFFACVSNFVEAQSVKYPTRIGVVKEAIMKTDKNGKPKKTPLKNVKIYTGTPTFSSSDANGKFTLKVNQAPFKISKIAKEGYQVLIPDHYAKSYNDNNETLDILMVSNKTINNYMDAQMEKARLAREKEKNEALIQIEKQKDNGEISYVEYFQKEDSINQSYKEKMERMVEYIERSSKEYFKGIEQIDKQIDDCIIKGEIDKADSLITSKGYFNQRIENIGKLKEITDKQIENTVSDCYKKYKICFDQVNYDKSLIYLDTARVLQETYLGYENPELAKTYNSIGIVYTWKGDYNQALEYFNKALVVKEKVLDSLSHDLASLYSNIGMIYDYKGYYDQALEWHNKALIIDEKILDSLSPDLASLYNKIGSVYNEKSNYDKALEWCHKALVIREKVLDPLSQNLATSYNNIGVIYGNKADDDKALEWFHKALVIREKILNPLNPSLAHTYNNIGVIYSYKGDLDKTLEYFNKALVIKEKVLDPLSLDLATAYNNIGVIYGNKGDNDKSLEWCTKALVIQEKVLNPLSIDLANSYINIGFVYLETKKYNEALTYFNKALQGFITNFGEEDENTQALKQKIEECKQALGE